jgi:hypothetical protein
MSLDLEQPAETLDSAPAEKPDSPQPTSIDTPEPEQALLPTDPDEIEDELEGVKLRGKKELLERIKNERLMQADYTRKTQEVAEQRRAIEAERAQFQETARMHQTFLREVAQVQSIDERLGQLQQLNLHQINAEDPQRAQALLIEFNQLQAARGQLVGSLTQRQQQQALQQQQETARRLQEGQAILARDIKGWSPELAGKLVDFGVSMGLSREALQNVTDPTVVKLLHRAYVGDQLEKQRTAKPPAEPPKPVTRIGGSAAANAKPLSEVTDPREWAERRRQRKSQNR